jgi:hypothetical protein
MTQRRPPVHLFAPFLILYVALFIYNMSRGSQWAIDASMSTVFLTFMYFANAWLRMGTTGFLVLNVPLGLHNMGTFGAYGWQGTWLAWDNLIHVLAIAVAAYYLFNLLAQRIHLHRDHRYDIDDRPAIMVFLVMAGALTFGMGMELMEFAGAIWLGIGEGVLLAGVGDDVGLGGLEGQYADTMTDIAMNVVGGAIGTWSYYLRHYAARET